MNSSLSFDAAPVGSLGGRGSYPRQKGTVWTPERIALARELDEKRMQAIDIWRALNALPGPPVRTPGSVNAKLYELRHGPRPRDVSYHTQTPPAKVVAAPPPPPFGEWTDERRRMGRMMYERGDSLHFIVDRLAKTPGAPLNITAVAIEVKRAGWRRPSRLPASVAPPPPAHTIPLSAEEIVAYVHRHGDKLAVFDTFDGILETANKLRAEAHLPPFRLAR